MVIVVTDAQAYYYNIVVLYIVASSQLADFAVPVSYSESIINVNLAIWPLFTKCNTFLCSRNQNVILSSILLHVSILSLYISIVPTSNI